MLNNSISGEVLTTFMRPLDLSLGTILSGKIDECSSNGSISFTVFTVDETKSYPLYRTEHRGQFTQAMDYYDWMEVPVYHAVVEHQLIPIELRKCSHKVSHLILLILFLFPTDQRSAHL
jgi:hypothetical protein